MVQRLYRLPATPSLADFEHLAENWRPWRTWATVLLRAAGARVADDQLSNRTAAVPIAASSNSTRLAAAPMGT